MELLATINPESVSRDELETFETRVAARAIVFDLDGNIALLNVTKRQHHKLPGGGVENDEDIKEAVLRECLEEIGCNIEIQSELGKVTEYRRELKLIGESYCYIAKVKDTKGAPNFTESEINKGFEIEWVSLTKAINLIKNESPTEYKAKFIVLRDLVFLEKAKEILT